MAFLLSCGSVEQDHDEAADGRHADNEDAKQGQRGEVRHLRTEPGADHEAGERLDEDREVEPTVEEVAQAACCRDGQDDMQVPMVCNSGTPKTTMRASWM